MSSVSQWPKHMEQKLSQPFHKHALLVSDMYGSPELQTAFGQCYLIVTDEVNLTKQFSPFQT